MGHRAGRVPDDAFGLEPFGVDLARREHTALRQVHARADVFACIHGGTPLD